MVTKLLHYRTISPRKAELPRRADEDILRAQCLLTVTKQMPFVLARVDAVPFKIIRTEDIQQPWDKTVCQSQGQAAQTKRKNHAMAAILAKVWGEKLDFCLFQQHVTISSFYLKAICFYPKPSHSCKLQPARVTRAETFISCRRCLKYSSRFVLSTH